MAGWMMAASVFFAVGGFLHIGRGAITDGLYLLLFAVLLFLASCGHAKVETDASADQAYRKCGRCGGKGKVHTTLVTTRTCPNCGGSGLEPNPFYRP